MRPTLAIFNNQGLASFGGGVTMLRHLAEHLAPDFEIAIYSFDQPTHSIAGVAEHTLKRPVSRSWRLAPWLKARQLARDIDGAIITTPDLVIAFDCHFALALKQARPRKLIYVSLSCIPRQEWFSSAGAVALTNFVQYAALEGIIARAADAVVASSSFHAQELKRFVPMGPQQPIVLPPILPSPAASARRADSSIPVVLCSGRLTPIKRYVCAVDAVVQLRDLPWRLVIAGDGPDRPQLEQRVAAAGLTNRVTFLGAVDDVTPHLATADILLHPSRYESLGMAVLEAMQAGVVPVAATDAHVGFRDFTRDGVDSVFTDFTRPEAASAAIRALLTDPARRSRLAQAARDTAERVRRIDYAGEFSKLVKVSLATGSKTGSL